MYCVGLGAGRYQYNRLFELQFLHSIRSETTYCIA